MKERGKKQKLLNDGTKYYSCYRDPLLHKTLPASEIQGSELCIGAGGSGSSSGGCLVGAGAPDLAAEAASGGDGGSVGGGSGGDASRNRRGLWAGVVSGCSVSGKLTSEFSRTWSQMMRTANNKF